MSYVVDLVIRILGEGFFYFIGGLALLLAILFTIQYKFDKTKSIEKAEIIFIWILVVGFPVAMAMSLYLIRVLNNVTG